MLVRWALLELLALLRMVLPALLALEDRKGKVVCLVPMELLDRLAPAELEAFLACVE